MDALRNTLLVLALLEVTVTVSVEDVHLQYGGGGGGAVGGECRVTRVSADKATVTVTCGGRADTLALTPAGAGDNSQDHFNQTLPTYLIPSSQNELSTKLGPNEDDRPNLDLDISEVFDHKDVDGQSLRPNDTKEWKNENDPRNLFLKRKSSSKYQTFEISKLLPHWPNITSILIYLEGNVRFMDISPFTNVKYISIHANGHTIPTIRVTKNILHLSVATSKLKGANFLHFFSSIKKLNLSNNDIEEIPLKELPPSTTCVDLSYNNINLNTNLSLPETLLILNISHNKIKTENVFIIRGNLLVLDIRRNKLKCIPILETPKMEELYLSGNNISTLKEDAFGNLTFLNILDLSHNYLTTLKEGVFKGLQRLQSLDMSENNIISLAPGTFHYLTNLVTLSLSENIRLGNLQQAKDTSFLFGTGQRLQVIVASNTNLTRIPSTLTRSVKRLIIPNNAIHSVQCGELDSFPLLQDIDISHNMISSIEEDALGRLDFLYNLNLSGNKLKDIPRSLPNHLKLFDLRCNIVEKLSNTDFLGLQKLRVLLLSRNKITVVEDGAFGQLSSLEVLDLSHNPIKTLSRSSFIGPRKLKEIYLASLRDLIPIQETLSFPAPESSHLEILNMEASPVLAYQLMEDVAALTMFHELFELNLNHCRLSTLRSDLPKYLPRLYKIELSGNVLNCSNIIWLVKWLQTLNISMQEPGKFRKGIYNLKDICCEKGSASETNVDTRIFCAGPEHLSGKEIISLREEDLSDMKLTSYKLPLPRQVSVTEHYLRETSIDSAPHIPPSASDMIDSSSEETLLSPSFTPPTIPKLSTEVDSMTPYRNDIFVEMMFSRPFTNSTAGQTPLNKSRIVPTSVIEQKSIHRRAQTWKYKNETKNESSNSELIIVLLNKTKSIARNEDNQDQLNESMPWSEGAHAHEYLAHEPPPTSHPGMVVFLLVVSFLLAATSVMVYSQCVQDRPGRDYHHHHHHHHHHQQDIEISSLGGSDLW